MPCNRKRITSKLGLVYMIHYIADMRGGEVNPVFSKLTEGRTNYGDKPSFSITVNHRSTYQASPIKSRALTNLRWQKYARTLTMRRRTIRQELSCPWSRANTYSIKAPITRQDGSHSTAMCLYSTQLAGITPAVVMCEMTGLNDA